MEGFKIRLILLPGMDGTGILFKPLEKLIPSFIEYEIIPLASFQSNKPNVQATELAEKLGNEEVVIFAESYSGLIAYELCKLNTVTIKHVFFAACFLERPTFLSKFSCLLPFSLLRSEIIPSAILGSLFFAKPTSSDLVNLFYQSLNNVSDMNLKSRLNVIALVKTQTDVINQPCTYIKASSDWLVSNKVIGTFRSLCLNINIVDVEGGHFIVQSNPSKCWELIQSVIT